MDETEKAYLAGLFDGDGSVFMREVFDKSLGRKNVLLEVSFTMQCRDTLEWIAQRFGGKVREPHKDYRAYIYKIGGPRALDIITTIAPYSITKHMQLTFVMWARNTFFQDGRGGGWRARLSPEILECRHLSCEIMKLLNKRDSMCFYGKSDEFSGRLSPLMKRIKDMITLSQASEGEGFEEGATTRETSPNSNSPHERPTSVH